MATAETARLIASLELQDKNFTRGIKQVERGVDRVDRKLGAFSGFVNRNLGRAIDSIAVRVVGSVRTGLEEMATLEDATTSVAGAIAQVGPGWTLTAADIATAANEIESSVDAAFDDKAIVGATETLIRYGKVSEGNLRPAMEVMTDLAARTGDVDSAATLLAKALADPAKAAGKLARSGVVLTKQQQKQITAMVEAGDVAGAQTFLLEELAKTTKGAAAASAGPYRDALNKLGDAGEDLRRGFVTGLAPAILEVSDLLTTELAKPSTIKVLKDVGTEVGSALKSVIGIAKSLPWDSIGNAMKLAGTGSKAILDMFLGLPPWVQTAVLTGWGLNKITGGALTSLLGGVVKGVLGMTAGVVNIKAGVVNGGGVGGVGGKGGGRFGRFGGAVGLAAGVVAVVGFERALAIWEETNQRSTEQAQTASNSLDAMLAQKPTTEAMKTSLAAVNTGINQIQANPLLTLVQGDALTELKAMRAKLEGEIEVKARPVIEKRAPINAALNQASIASREASRTPISSDPKNSIVPAVKDVGSAVKNAQSIQSRENSAQKAELTNIKTTTNAGLLAQTTAITAGNVLASVQAAGQAVRDATQTGAIRSGTSQQTGAVRAGTATTIANLSSGFSRVVSAIYANRAQLSVQATTVVNRYSVAQRGGATSDSRTRSGV